MKKIIRSRKANIINTSIVFVISMFIFIMISFYGYFLYGDLTETIEPELTHNDSVNALNEVGDRYSSVFTGLIVLLFVGLWTLVIVMSFVGNDHPILFAFSIIAIVFVLIAQMVLSNFYEEFWSDVMFAGVTSAFSIPNFLMTHALEINIGIIVTALIIAYTRTRYEG